MCMHVMNEYVFHVNCAHKAYCYGLAQTLHFFGHANMPTCNQQTGRAGVNDCGGIKVTERQKETFYSPPKCSQRSSECHYRRPENKEVVRANRTGGCERKRAAQTIKI